MREYNPALLGFVIKLSSEDLQNVKTQLVEVASSLEPDDKVYLYPGEQVPRQRGESVGRIANYQPEHFILGDGVKQTVLVLTEEDEDANKKIFVVTDSFDQKMEYRLEKSFLLDLQISLDGKGECSFYLCLIGENYDKDAVYRVSKKHPNCQVKEIDSEKLSDCILENLKLSEKAYEQEKTQASQTSQL